MTEAIQQDGHGKDHDGTICRRVTIGILIFIDGGLSSNVLFNLFTIANCTAISNAIWEFPLLYVSFGCLSAGN
jgi:hypothetical protein